MDPLLAVILTRAAERIIVVLAGILSIYVGYKLFALVPERREGTGKMSLPGGASFFMSKVGPGVFFALFGTGLIGYSATRPVSFAQPGFAIAQSEGGRAEYTGLVSGRKVVSGGGLPPGSAAREDVIGYLNAWFAALPADTPVSVRVDRQIALKEAKLALMREVWDADAWGDYMAFHRWATVSAASGPPPEGSELAVALFQSAPE